MLLSPEGRPISGVLFPICLRVLPAKAARKDSDSAISWRIQSVYSLAKSNSNAREAEDTIVSVSGHLMALSTIQKGTEHTTLGLNEGMLMKINLQGFIFSVISACICTDTICSKLVFSSIRIFSWMVNKACNLTCCWKAHTTKDLSYEQYHVNTTDSKFWITQFNIGLTCELLSDVGKIAACQYSKEALELTD